MSFVDKRLQLLTIQPYRWYIISSLLAAIGNGLSYVTMTWLVVGERDAISSVAILMLCFWIPVVVLGPIAGVLADKFNRKRLMIITILTRAAILLFMAWVLTWNSAPVVMYFLAALQGICFSIYSPAVMAAIREIVPERDLLHANILQDMVYEVGSMIGMGCSGLLMHLLSGAGTILLDGLLFLGAATALFMMGKQTKLASTLPKKQVGFFTELGLGLRYLSQNRVVCIIYIIQLFIFVVFVTAPILSAPYAKNVLHANVTQFGMIEALISVGVVLGGLFAPYVAQIWGVKKIIVFEVFMLTICLALFSINRIIYRAEILYFLIGLCLSVWPLIVTRAQELTDLNYQGRVHSTFSSVSGVLVLILYFSANVVGDSVSVHALYWFQVALVGVAALLVLRFHRVFDRRVKSL